MKQLLLSIKFLLLFFFLCFQTYAQRPFIGIWYPAKEHNSDKVSLIQVKIHLEGRYFYTWTHIQKPNINGKGSGTDSLHLFFPEEGGYRITLKPKRKNPLHRIKSGKSLRKIEQWGDIKWSTMKEAFRGAIYMSMNSTDVPDLNNVTDMSYMFQGTYLFNTPIGHWDVSNVTDMSEMFSDASAFNQPLEQWNVSKVTNMNAMFQSTRKFNQPIEQWDVSNVTDMGFMFRNTSAFNQPLEKWDVSNVANMVEMFSKTWSFNQPLGKWNVSNVTSMGGMFYGARAFNQSLGNWNLKKINSLGSIFLYSNLDCKNYGLTLKGWAENPETPHRKKLYIGLKYNEETEVYRNILINEKDWEISRDRKGKCNEE